MKRKNILLIFAIGATIVAAYPLLLVQQAYTNLDADSKHLVEIIVIAIVGGLLFFLRRFNLNLETRETIENLDLLILVVIPSVDISVYMMKTPANFAWAMLPFVVGTMGWFNLVILKHKISTDPKQEKRFTVFTVYIMSVLSLIAIIATWLILTLLTIQSHVVK